MPDRKVFHESVSVHKNIQAAIFASVRLTINSRQMTSGKNFILVCCLFFLFSVSCKTVARTAARYWTKRQIKTFIHQCEAKTANWIGQEQAHKYCDCAVDVVAEKYKAYKQTQTLQLTDLLEIINGCR